MEISFALALEWDEIGCKLALILSTKVDEKVDELVRKDRNRLTFISSILVPPQLHRFSWFGG